MNRKTDILALSLLSSMAVVPSATAQTQRRHATTSKIDTTAYYKLGEVQVTAKTGVGHLRQTGYNALTIDTRQMQNTTKTLADALRMAPGLKLRETGGVGGETNIMLDGMDAKYVKVFIDGIPQEGVGSAYRLSNIPAGTADHIEIYKGVVPVEFGTDAMGGVINIVTRRRPFQWYADASYSYGSFNTHRSTLRAGQRLKHGWSYDLSFYQNYSDNDYKVKTFVTQFLDNGFEQTDRNKIETVRRFHGRYHNEAITAAVGLTGQRWADKLLFNMTYSHEYRQIQNGVRQEIVYGQKHRKGHVLMPRLTYSKRHFLVHGLQLDADLGYSHNVSYNVDTAAYKYNWYGQRRWTGTPGEQGYQNTESATDIWTARLAAKYQWGHRHLVTLNYSWNHFNRKYRSYLESTSRITDYSLPKKTDKNIVGLSYHFTPSRLWNVVVFGKYYNELVEGPVSKNEDGIGGFIRQRMTSDALGYGTALSIFPLKGWQARLSYEKAYRLPTITELFGDDDLESGRAGLQPEMSHNFNVSLSYDLTFGQQALHAEATGILRNTRNFIRRTIESVSGTYYGAYENHGRVRTMGYMFSLRYSPLQWLTLGATYNDIAAKDRERRLSANSGQSSLHYNVRMPNMPYRYGTADITMRWTGLGGSANTLTFNYNLNYQHKFPLYWENIGSADSKKRVPTQTAHDMTLTYSIGARYHLSLECNNITNEELYDNFSIQKPGRAFYAKVRVFLGK